MASSNNEEAFNFPFFKLYKDGRIERRESKLYFVPAGLDPNTGVQTKDVVVSPETGVKARIFKPKTHNPDQKLPLLVHYHGGAFCVGSAFDSGTSFFLTHIVSQANAIAISIDYRLAPENPLPIPHEDSWAGLQWVAAHSKGVGPEPWLNKHADLRRVFLVGDSAGANIAHYVAIQAGVMKPADLNTVGLLMVHPFFGVKEDNEIYKVWSRKSSGCENDPIMNPEVDPNLKSLGCERVIVFVAEKDKLRPRGVAYYETLIKSEWSGCVEWFESKGEDHVFHLFNHSSQNVEPLMKKIADFIKQ